MSVIPFPTVGAVRSRRQVVLDTEDWAVIRNALRVAGVALDPADREHLAWLDERIGLQIMHPSSRVVEP